MRALAGLALAFLALQAGVASACKPVPLYEIADSLQANSDTVLVGQVRALRPDWLAVLPWQRQGYAVVETTKVLKGRGPRTVVAHFDARPFVCARAWEPAVGQKVEVFINGQVDWLHPSAHVVAWPVDDIKYSRKYWESAR